MALKDVAISGWLKDVNDNFDTIEPLVSGDAVGLGVMRVARFSFDPSLTAASRTIAAHGTGVTIPANAVVVGGFYDVNTAFTSASTNTGEIAISVQAANDVLSSLACSDAKLGTIGRKAIIPKANTPESTSLKTSAAKEITCTVSVAALTAGKLTGYLYYIEGLASA